MNLHIATEQVNLRIATEHFNLHVATEHFNSVLISGTSITNWVSFSKQGIIFTV